MLFVWISILSFNLFAQTTPLPNPVESQCVLELDLDSVASDFYGLDLKYQEHFLTLAHFRLSLDKNPSHHDFYFSQLNLLRDGILKKYSLEQFNLFFLFAHRLVINQVFHQQQKEEVRDEKKALFVQALRVLIGEDFVWNGKVLKNPYAESPHTFKEHQQKGYFDVDLGIDFLNDSYGVPFSEEIKELIDKLVHASDLEYQNILTLLLEIKPKLTFGNLEDALYFEKALHGSSLGEWAKKAIPQIFLKMHSSPTRLGTFIAKIFHARDFTHGLKDDLVSSKQIDKEKIGFILRALKGPNATQYWTNQTIVQAFKEITDLMQFDPITLRPMVSFDQALQSWLSVENAHSLKAKARYLGLTLNQPAYEKLVELIPQGERKGIEQEIDEFTIYRRLRLAIESVEIKKNFIQLFFDSKKDVKKELLNLLFKLELESFEFVKIPAVPLSELFSGTAYFATTRVTQGFVKLIYGLNDLVKKVKTPSQMPQAKNDRGGLTYNYSMENIDYIEAQNLALMLTELVNGAHSQDSSQDPCQFRVSEGSQFTLMARGGTQSKYWFGNNREDSKDRAYVSSIFGVKLTTITTHSVVGMGPNPYGVYILGDVGEMQSPLSARSSIEVYGGGIEDYLLPDFHYSTGKEGGAAFIGFRLIKVCF